MCSLVNVPTPLLPVAAHANDNITTFGFGWKAEAGYGGWELVR
jgi:hypothetical protein